MTLREVGKRLTAKGLFYWLNVFVLVVVGVLAGHWLEKQDVATDLRYRAYQFVTRGSSSRKPYATRTAAVLVGDEEFWRGELARRTPPKRLYLAQLIRARDAADASAVALDFDLRWPDPSGAPLPYNDYDDETRKLLEAVRDVSKRRPVILPRTIRWESGYYVHEPDLYDGFDFQGGKVLGGHVLLPFDVRRVPLGVVLKDGTTVNSFAEALVRLVNEKALEPVEGFEDAPYGSYLTAADFPVYSASALLAGDPAAVSGVHHRIVILGAAWSRLAFGRGPRIDTHVTPVGPMPGALVHANFVEALLDRRTAPAWSESALMAFDAGLAFAVAIIFALIERLRWKLAALLALCAAVVTFSVLSWLNLGLFYDFFIPVVLVIGHAFYEEAHEHFGKRQAHA